MTTDCSHQLTFWDIGRQQVTVDFDGACVVSDAGLLPIRLLDHQLGVLADVAQRLPDPRAQKFVTHSREALLAQEGYQILAGYPDGNDAQTLRDDPLFQTLVGVSPNEERSLASGSTRRFVVTNLSGDGQGIYHGFYVPRGDVAERPSGALKNGLHMDRLSFHRFRANGLKLLEHTLAYALVVLHREATASIPEVAQAEVNTQRQRLWKVGAVVKTSVRRIWFHVSTRWPNRRLFERVCVAVRQFLEGLRKEGTVLPNSGLLPLL